MIRRDKVRGDRNVIPPPPLERFYFDETHQASVDKSAPVSPLSGGQIAIARWGRAGLVPPGDRVGAGTIRRWAEDC